MNILQRSSPRQEGTSSAAAPNTDRTIVLHAGAAARSVSTKVLSVEDGFIAKRTESGRSLDSLEPYARDWNSVDLDEVTSNPHPVPPHPAGLSALCQRVHEADVAADVLKMAVQTIGKIAKVIIRNFTETCISS